MINNTNNTNRMKDVLRIVQINARSTRSVEKYLQNAEQLKADILLLVESPRCAHDVNENCFLNEHEDSQVAIYRITPELAIRKCYAETHHVAVKIEMSDSEITCMDGTFRRRAAAANTGIVQRTSSQQIWRRNAREQSTQLMPMHIML